ncbi:MAG: FHA domain-containing protein [Bacteroidales bacterium]|nr:FHA domain-containing protein [Bacteroidales bacterium]
MSSFSLCPNGHYYDSKLDKCPYCPSEGNKNTSNINPSTPMDKTKIFNEDDLQGADKTKIEGVTGRLDKTRIFTPENETASVSSEQAFHPGRKITGWLVTFSMIPEGLDFRLFEGRNIIGSDPGCDIVISQDAAISSKHLTILYRQGSFKYKDELSTNGTCINGEFVEEGNLNDGDEIKIGNTVFKFRSIS